MPLAISSAAVTPLPRTRAGEAAVVDEAASARRAAVGQQCETAAAGHGQFERRDRAGNVAGRQVVAIRGDDPRRAGEHVGPGSARNDLGGWARRRHSPGDFGADRHQPPLPSPRVEQVVFKRPGTTVVTDRIAGKAGADEDLRKHRSDITTRAEPRERPRAGWPQESTSITGRCAVRLIHDTF